MGLNLFDGDDSDDISKIEVNREFARRYEHNKKREDLQRLEELKKKGLAGDSSEDSESSSSDEDDDDDGISDSSKRDLQFFDALLKVRNQDPSLKQKDARLFESESESNDSSEDEEEGKDSSEEKNKNFTNKKEKDKNKKKKPMYLKDVLAKQLVEAGPELGDGNEETAKMKSYVEEQEELRRAFLNAAEAAEDENEDEGDFLKEKERKNENDNVGDDEDGVEFQNKLDEYFGGDGELDGDSIFLRDYFLNKMWVDKEKGGKALGEELEGVSEDEEEIERQEDYEREYNFRFEENAGDRVLGHARFVEGSVRKMTNARKEQRKRKEERMTQAEFERKEELKHLKNLKKEEIIGKRIKIREIAGIGEDGVCAFDVDDLEEDFDPEEHDRKMKGMFGEDYYDAADVDPEFGGDRDEDGAGFEKPDFEKEDELLGLPKNWDVCGSGEGFLTERERILKRKAGVEGEEKQGGGIVPEEDKQKRKRNKELDDEEMEEIYKLDYEDTIGDLKTRFKYAKVSSNRYGLKPEELLMMDDKELNQYVSLKKLAPYKENEWKVPNSKRYEQKKRNKLLLQGGKLNDQKTGKKKSLNSADKRLTSVMGEMEDGKAQFSESKGDVGNLSRRSKRRRRQAELRLSHSRLLAYGKIPAKPKNKVKH